MKPLLLASTILSVANALAQVPPPRQPSSTSAEETAKVTASGTVPDDATRTQIIGRLRELYGSTNVVDRLEVSAVVAPPKWAANMDKILNANLKQIHGGKIQVTGTQVSLKGSVTNEVLCQKVASDMAAALNPTYTINNGLTVSNSKQDTLDKALSNRVVEFETGSANLTTPGQRILDEMAAAIMGIGTPKVHLIGHTDNAGNRLSNLRLSLARANAVRTYLIGKGISPETLSTGGAGSDHPISTNDTQQGRAQNRRIEFRLAG